MDYLTLQVLPQDDLEARELLLSRDQYDVIVGILYHLQPDKTSKCFLEHLFTGLQPDKTLRIIP